jgi:periplasmic protein TonB
MYAEPEPENRISPPSRKFLLALLFSAISHAVAITLVDPGTTPAPAIAPLRLVISRAPAAVTAVARVIPEKPSRTPDQEPDHDAKPDATPEAVVEKEAVAEPAPKAVLKKAARVQKPRPQPPMRLPPANSNPPPAQKQVTVVSTPSVARPTAPAAAAVTEESREVEYLYNPPPDYPRRARRLGLEGEVLIRTRVMPNGESDELVLAQSSGHTLLDQAAMAAVRKWRFRPARRGDERIVSWVEIPVRFRLER